MVRQANHKCTRGGYLNAVPPLSPQTRGSMGHRCNSTLIGSDLMDQPLEPWLSDGGTGVVAAVLSNQG